MSHLSTSYSKLFLSLFATAFFVSIFSFLLFVKPVLAVTGINRQINFQGKLVNADGTNVADSTYSVVFTLYDTSSGGTGLWTETDSVTTLNGIFRVALGANTAIPANFNFNWSGLYLGIKVGADAEMIPRVQMTAVPFAFNAQQVAGLTVQDSSGNSSTSGTLQIPNAQTVSFGNAFTTNATGALTINAFDSGGNTLNLPATGAITLVGTTQTQDLTNKTYNGLTVTSSTLKPTASGGLAIDANGSNALSLGANDGNAIIFGKSGTTYTMNGLTGNQSDILALGSSGSLTTIGTTALSQQCLLSSGGTTGSPVWGSCGVAGTSSPFQTSGTGNELITQGNITQDLLLGGTSTTSAKFAFINTVGSGTPTASIAGTTNNNALSLDGNGNIQTENGNTLTLGGNTTGDIALAPNGSTAMTILGNGNVGIGTLSPVSSLDIAHTFTSPTPGNNYGQRITIANTGAVSSGVDSTYGQYIDLTRSGATNGAIDLAGQYITATMSGETNELNGSDIRLNGGVSANGLETILNTNPDENFYSIYEGVNANVDHNGSGILQTATGVGGFILNENSGSITDASGLYGYVENGSIGSITNAYGAQLHILNDDVGSITNAYGVDVFTPTNSGGGTYTNNYGVYINDQSSVGSNISYNLYSAGASAKNYFAGLVGIGSASPLAKLDVIGSNGTIPVASFSGQTSFAGLVVDNSGNGDLFTASSSGFSRFTITQSGGIGLGSPANVGTSSQCLLGGSSASWGVCATGGSSSPFQAFGIGSELITQGNITQDLLLGGIASASATFHVFGSTLAGTNPVASISANTSFAGLVVDNQGTGDLFTASSSGMPRFTITQGGNVGIGTTTPTNLLTIEGQANSNGSSGTQMITASADQQFTAGNTWGTSGTPLWSINVASSGKAAKDAPGIGALQLPNISLNPSLVVGQYYEVQFDFTTTASSSGSLIPSMGGANGAAVGQDVSMNITNYVYVFQASNTNQLTFTPTSSWYGKIDNVTVTVLTASTAVASLINSNGTAGTEFRSGGNGLQNTFSGYHAGLLDTTGTGNIATGYNALLANTNGSYNTASGNEALNSNTNGSYNTGDGNTALFFNTWGFNNTASGYAALYSNSTGSYNTASGANALNSNSTGNRNTVSGYAALYLDSTGSNNTALGYNAGFHNSTGTGNLFLGYDAGANELGSGKLYLANTNTTNPLIYGDFNAGLLGMNLPSTNGVPNASPLATLDVRTGSGILSVASVSGKTSFAGLVVDNSGAGDLFTASSSGLSRFTITQSGGIGLGSSNNVGTSSQCLLGGSSASWGACPTGGSNSPFQTAGVGSELITEGNITQDLLLGGIASASATFHVFGSTLAGTNPVASISAKTSFAGLVVDNKGSGDLFTASSSGLTRFVINQAGNVGIGTINPTTKLSVAGDVLFKNLTNTTTAFQIQNATGSNLFTADTTNFKTGVNTNYTVMTAPSGLSAIPVSGGALTAGTYLYEVTAIDSAGGETTVSNEASGTTSGGNLKISLTWTRTQQASGYKIYRTASGGTSGTEVYLTSVLTNSFIDDGKSVSPVNGMAGLPTSNTGYIATASANNNQLQLAVGSNGNPTGQLYVSGTTPKLIETYQSSLFNAADSVTVVGRYAYLTADTASVDNFLIFDVNNPYSPTFVGGVNLPTAGNFKVTVQGRYAYVAGHDGQAFYVIDISNPSSPSIVSTMKESGYPTGLDVQGRYAYLANWASTDDNKFTIFDIANPASPQQIATASAGLSKPFAVQVVGRYAYIADDAGSLVIYDVTNPTSPTNIGSVSVGNNADGVSVQGRYVYVASANGVTVVDVSNPVSPTVVGNVNDITAADTIYVQGRYAYVGSDDGDSNSKVAIYDVSNPTNPVQVGYAGNLGLIYTVSVDGRYLYAASWGDSGGHGSLYVFDIGGAYIQQLEAGGAELGTLAVDGNTQISGQLNITSGLNVGTGAQIYGGVGIYNGGAVIQGGEALTGGLNLISAPIAPTVIPVNGTGSTTWSYAVTAINAYGGETTASPVTSINNGLSTLTSSSYNAITWSPVVGATSYKVYRTAGSAFVKKGVIAVTSATDALDIGNPVTSTLVNLPTINSTGQLTVQGAALLRDTTDSSSAFQIQNAAGMNVLTIGTTGTTPIASFSANTSFAGLVVDNAGKGDLLTASSSGLSRFVVNQNGNIQFGGNTSFLNTLTTVATAARVYTLPDVSGTLCLSTNNCAANQIWNSGNGSIFADNLTQDLLLGGVSTSSATFHVFGSTLSGTNPVASISANTSFAGLVVDNAGKGDLFTASSSGLSRFTLTQSGGIGLGAPANVGTSSQCLLGGSSASWGACGTGGASSPFQSVGGTVQEINNTQDFLLGGIGTTSAKFSIAGLNTGSTPIASLSAQTGNTGLSLDSNGTIQTYDANSLTLGGAGTGNIIFSPNGATGEMMLSSTGLILGAGSTNGLLTLFTTGGGETSPSIAADVSGNLNLSAPTGTVNIGNNTGNITFDSGSNDVLFGFNSTNFGGFYHTNQFAIGTTSPIGTVDLRALSGTKSVASISGMTSFSALVVDNSGKGDLFTASSSGLSRFTLTQSGGIGLGSLANVGTSSQCLFGGSSASWGACATGTSSPLQSVGGTIQENNITQDLLIGGTSSSSATFHVFGSTLAGTNPVASISANTSFAGLVVDNSGKGDIFTASSSGLTRLTLTQNGILALGTLRPTATLFEADAAFTPTTDLADIGNIAGQEPTAAGINALQLTWFTKPATGTIDGAARDILTNKNTTTGGLAAAFRVSSTGAGGVVNSPTDALLIDGLLTASKGTTAQNAIQIGANWDSSIFGDGDLVINAGGNIILATSSASTKVSIGSSAPLYNFDVQESNAATASARIFNTNNGANAGGLIVQLGFTGTGTKPTTNQITGNSFIRFLGGTGLAKGSIDSNGANGVIYQTGGVDYAEYYLKANSQEQFTTGELVCLTSNGGVSACSNTNTHIQGVISENPGFVGGSNHIGDNNYALVGTLGQLPVKVDASNGAIHAGDALTVSPVTGVVMKAKYASEIVGRAQESYDPSRDSKTTIMASINLTWYDPGVIVDANGNVTGGGMKQVATVAEPSVSESALLTLTDRVSNLETNVASLSGMSLSSIGDGVTVDATISAGLTLLQNDNRDIHSQLNDIASRSAYLTSLLQRFASGSASLADLGGLQIPDATVSSSSVATDSAVVHKIKADEIDGLDTLVAGLVQQKIGSMSAQQDVLSASTSSLLTSLLAVSSVPDIASSSSNFASNIFATGGVATVSGDLQVHGSGLFEGMLTVIDTLNANDFIARGISDFFSTAIFHKNVTFIGQPTFNPDTAGTMVIKKGTSRAQVVFTTPYDTVPAVTVTLQTDLTASAFFSKHYTYTITDVSTKGFTLLLNKQASGDVTASWIAIQTSGAEK